MKTKAILKLCVIILVSGILATACQKINESADNNVTLKSEETGTTNPYTVSVTSTDGLSFTTVITKNTEASLDINHILVLLVDCNNEFIPMDAGKFSVLKINQENYLDKVGALEFTTTDDCYFGDNAKAWAGYFFKVNFVDSVSYPVTIEYTISSQAALGNLLIDAGDDDTETYCGGECSEYSYSFEGYCNKICTEFNEETAWAEGIRYTDKGDWATYTPYMPDNTVILYAGRTMEAGTVHFSEVIDNKVRITITLAESWAFAYTDENVKIMDYQYEPGNVQRGHGRHDSHGHDRSGRNNCAPGKFIWKGTAEGQSFYIDVPASSFYGVHVDLGQWVEVECETAN